MKKKMAVSLFVMVGILCALPYRATRLAAEFMRKDVDESIIAPSAPVGAIYRLDAGKHEVLVATKRVLKMGERVYAELGDGKAIMIATFPMMTSSKCTLEASSRKYFGQLAKGMPVYAYVPGEKKAKQETDMRINSQDYAPENDRYEKKGTIDDLIGSEMPCRNVNMRCLCNEVCTDMPESMSNTLEYKNVFSYMQSMNVCNDILIDCLMLEAGGKGYIRIIKDHDLSFTRNFELKYTMKNPGEGSIYWRYRWDTGKKEYVESGTWGLYATFEVIYDKEFNVPYGDKNPSTLVEDFSMLAGWKTTGDRAIRYMI